MFDLYLANRTDSCRFLLGKAGTRTLFIVGLNPSTANREKPDVTATKVARIAEANGYYPKRSTDPRKLPERADHRLLNRNLEAILELAALQKRAHFWAAWGGDISTRPWLLRACRGLVSEVEKIKGRWFCFGPCGERMLMAAGHPRHPSRLSYAWQLQAFDVRAYVAAL